MTCEDCREAGEFNAQANNLDAGGMTRWAGIAREEARALHARCTGCTCQHRIGKLNVPPKAEPPTEVETERVSDSD